MSKQVIIQRRKTYNNLRVTDKILKLINDVVDKNIDKIKIILKATVLDKKSKLRNLFEKIMNY